MALQHIKNSKSPVADGTTAQLPKAGGKPVLEVHQKLFNSVLGATTPEQSLGLADDVVFMAESSEDLSMLNDLNNVS